MTNQRDPQQIRADLDEITRQLSQNAVQGLDTLAEHQLSLSQLVVKLGDEVVSLSERVSVLEAKG